MKICLFSKGTRQKKKNVENSTLGHPPPMTEIVENFQKKNKTKKSLKNLKKPKIRQFP